jgi:protein-disulfide isomerase
MNFMQTTVIGYWVKWRTAKGLLLLLFIAGTAAPALADGLSREQGDAIVSELRQIRQLLEKQRKPDEPVKPAQPEKVRLKLGNDFSLGSKDAPLVMVEYTDYQCPFCSRFYSETFPGLKKRFIDTGKLRFITRDFPLEFHQHSLKAAQATRCTGDQGKFWEMKDALMKNQPRLTSELIDSLARDLSINTERFQGCVKEGGHVDEIKAGMAAAGAVGINGTPSFVVGKVVDGSVEGYRIVGAQPIEEFEKLFQDLEAGDRK